LIVPLSVLKRTDKLSFTETFEKVLWTIKLILLELINDEQLYWVIISGIASVVYLTEKGMISLTSWAI